MIGKNGQKRLFFYTEFFGWKRKSRRVMSEFAHIDFGSLPMVNSARADSEDTDALERREIVQT